LTLTAAVNAISLINQVL